MDTSTKTRFTFLALVFVVGHFLFFFVIQEQQDTTLLRPLPDDLITKRDSLRQESFKKDTPSIHLTPINSSHGMPIA
jgi:hypothetical protein